MDFGVLSNVDQYDQAEPNEEYGNSYPPSLPPRSSLVVDLAATMARATDQAIANDASTAVTYSSKVDPYEIATTTSGDGGYVVAPRTGVYELLFSAFWDSVSGGNRRVHIERSTDGGSTWPTVLGTETWAPGSSETTTANTRFFGRLNQGDRLRVRVYQNRGGPLNLTVRSFSFSVADR